jgi:hypothetical protein
MGVGAGVGVEATGAGSGVVNAAELPVEGTGAGVLAVVAGAAGVGAYSGVVGVGDVLVAVAVSVAPVVEALSLEQPCMRRPPMTTTWMAKIIRILKPILDVALAGNEPWGRSGFGVFIILGALRC